ncbi:IclR family transcriptional regulator domain-containing protein [Streptomyces sp. H27-D2]|uniref:IclR family transcriptional regulator domain-containing protein n=1 Tax=Streptomyces sp. H27-D2 TaxID=3046304 RepID=UPI002DB63D2A|nr:IclR family transcriptional regulator C-terminal domain-containing protein [Streptomyces sp. H27-D2]MEC4019967.1 IclR family transcriptional regulator C-terminal domain-containing protein [Streptomyces sp. H27-D2]
MPDESVGPLERGAAVLRAMAAADAGPLRPGDLVRTTGLARSTVDRVLGTLEHLGYVRADGRDVSLAPGLMELGNAYLSASGLPQALGPFAERLADAFDESVSLAVPDADGVRFIAQATRRRTMSLAFRIGDLLPAERCAPGAIFATEWQDADWAAWRARRADDPFDAGFPTLPQRREASSEADFARVSAAAARDGWASDDQLIEPGLVAVAVPVRGAAGRIACVLSVVSHTSRHTAASLRELVLERLRAETVPMEAALAKGAGAGAEADARFAGAAVSGSTAVGEDPARTAEREMGPGFLQSLARGLAVLRALGGTGASDPGAGVLPGGMTLTAVAEATGLARATARRSLLTLDRLGYAAADGRLFRPLPRVLELGYAQLTALSFTDIAQPHLRELVRRRGESVSMTVLDGGDIRYIARVPTVRIMSVNITLGTRFPAYATSMGRVLLAGLDAPARAVQLAGIEPRPLTRRTVTSVPDLHRILDQVAADGHALVDEELEEGLRSLAVPVRDASGVVAAINVALHAGRGAVEETRRDLLPALYETAARIEADVRTASMYRALRIG